MASERDPEGNELSQLINAYPISGKKALEIGCGDGKLTCQYSNLPDHLIGIDPCMADLQAAQNKRSPGKLYLVQAKGEELPFSNRVFDLVIFASSL
ncbi:MAG: hypothetical protein C3F13_14330 [Anaerolineales bacterium]|nr:class I SAM-dependent methyltransferase [Anaerolineae bacterium]PWB51607.1 MAG: hypothetical protein C3F13_14330 [Anaerolineales bacterium]